MIELPFPAKILWPNGRGHHMAKHRAFREHKRWAYLATLAHYQGEVKAGREFKPAAPLNWLITVYPKTRNKIDDDNARAAMKAYQDGIALALDVNDSTFAAPRLQFGEPVKGGRVVVSIL